jgi:osmoprotectant transport system permease protein
MKPERARELGISSIADLEARAPQLKLGSDLEFLSRPEWADLRRAYDLRFKSSTAYQPTFMYHALEDGQVDVISAFSSDGRIAADHLVVLSDPRRALPPYDAVILVSPRRANDSRLIVALSPLVGAISVQLMREANYSVDRPQDKLTPSAAARWLDTRIRR